MIIKKMRNLSDQKKINFCYKWYKNHNFMLKMDLTKKRTSFDTKLIG